MAPRKNVLDFANLLRKRPWLPVKVLAKEFGCGTRSVQKFLAQLHVVKKRGTDPVNGRANVILYAIELPKDKLEGASKKSDVEPAMKTRRGDSMNINLIQNYIISANSLPETFHFFSYESIKNGKDYFAVKFNGGNCPLRKKGPNKGKPNFSKVTDQRSFYVTYEEADSVYEEYEQLTGTCARCLGEETEVVSWSRKDGVKYRPCSKCAGTGKAS